MGSQQRKTKSDLPRPNPTTAVLRKDEHFLEDIYKQIGQIESEREEQIEKLIKSVEEFKQDRLPYGEDNALASKCRHLLHHLHKKLKLCQNEVQSDKLGPEDHHHGDSTRTTSVSEDNMMPIDFSDSGKRYSDVKVVKQAMFYEDPRRADHRLNDGTKTLSGSANISTTTGHSHDKTGHLCMKVTEQDVMGHKMGRRQMPEKAACSDSIKTAADKAKETNMSRRTPSKSGHPDLEVSDQSSLEADGLRKLCLLLLGSSGNGKSSMGNSILGKEEFETSSSVNSSAPRIAMGSSQVGDQTVCVVDGPSVLDSRDAGEEFMERIIIAMETSLTLCDYAFSAIVIVLKFGVRFTKQEVDTIKLIKAVLGKNIIRDYGICAITYGDNFEHAVEEAIEEGEELTFEGWCREQTGEVKGLFEECSFRCVLFDNRTKDEDKKLSQRELLLKIVDPTRTYSKEEFLKAEESLKEVLDKEASIHELEQQTQQLIDSTRNGIDEISEDDSYQDSNSLDSLLQGLKLHQEYIEGIGLSSPKLSQLLMSLKFLQNEIHFKIRQRRLMEDNMRSTAPSSRNVYSLTSSKPTRPLPTCDLHSVGHASGSGNKSRNMNYTSSNSDWCIEPSEWNRPPTYPGHVAASSDLVVTGRLGTIWDYFKKLFGKN